MKKQLLYSMLFINASLAFAQYTDEQIQTCVDQLPYGIQKQLKQSGAKLKPVRNGDFSQLEQTLPAGQLNNFKECLQQTAKKSIDETRPLEEKYTDEQIQACVAKLPYGTQKQLKQSGAKLKPVRNGDFSQLEETLPAGQLQKFKKCLQEQ